MKKHEIDYVSHDEDVYTSAVQPCNCHDDLYRYVQGQGTYYLRFFCLLSFASFFLNCHLQTSSYQPSRSWRVNLWVLAAYCPTPLSLRPISSLHTGKKDAIFHVSINYSRPRAVLRVLFEKGYLDSVEELSRHSPWGLHRSVCYPSPGLIRLRLKFWSYLNSHKNGIYYLLNTTSRSTASHIIGQRGIEVELELLVKFQTL